jgi:hypothetical protein
MIDRLVAGLAAALLLAAGPAAPTPSSPAAGPAAPTPSSPAAGDDLWPYPQGCVSVTLDAPRGVYRPDSTWWEPWFDATVRGRSTPCRRPDAGATLAVTQYHVRDGAVIGLMSTPWRAAARGTTPFSRFGRIEPDVAALCVSTGLSTRDGAVVARHAVCVRPLRTGTDHLVTRFAPVPLTDPLVGAALSRYPSVGTAPTGPFCRVDCLVSPYRTVPGPPRTTKDTPIDGPTDPLAPYEPVCHTVSIVDSFAGPSDDNVNGFDVWLAGAVDSCDPGGELPTVHAIRYWPDRGVVMPAWDLGQFPLAKGAQVNENTGALCVATGFRERAGRLYGVHDLCWRIQQSQRDIYRLVPIRTDDPRVRKPLVSNIPIPDPEQPPGVCASCL